jgi:hypothetical protein
MKQGCLAKNLDIRFLILGQEANTKIFLDGATGYLGSALHGR